MCGADGGVGINTILSGSTKSLIEQAVKNRLEHSGIQLSLSKHGTLG